MEKVFLVCFTLPHRRPNIDMPLTHNLLGNRVREQVNVADGEEQQQGECWDGLQQGARFQVGQWKFWHGRCAFEVESNCTGGWNHIWLNVEMGADSSFPCLCDVFLIEF
ncbi:hypothetical protein SDJN02_06803, partial [Cucurbita argyrosperma subsp. argyrosperma]